MPTSQSQAIEFKELETWKVEKQTNKSIKLTLWFNQTEETALSMAKLIGIGDEVDFKVRLVADE